MKIVTTVRDAVYEAIYAARRELIITDFELTKTYYPDVKLQGITKPRVYVVGSQWTEEKLSRNNTKSVTLPVQVAVIQKVIPTDTDAIDTLIAFVEELNACVANVTVPGFMWTRTDGQKDPNGTPLSFVSLHEDHRFQAVFTAHFLATVCQRGSQS
jgi:hypothetical protein